MKIIALFTALSFFLMLTTVQGQYENAKDAFAMRGNLVNFQFPITDNFLSDDFTGGMELEYNRHLTKALNIAFPLKLGVADFPTDEKGGVDKKGFVSLDALLQLKYFKASSFIYPYLFAGLGVTLEDLEDTSFGAPLGVGLNFKLGNMVYLSTKGEYRFSFDDLRDNLQLSAGLFLLLGEGEEKPPVISDRDGDGVPDGQDLCPDQAGVVGLNGCPDSDSDGIADGEDECPNLAGLMTLKGCPDADRDGIADKDDDCPNEAGLAENNGCPLRDTDGDGVVDDEDDCPNAAGPAFLRGCPDGDGDGIADKDDSCPTVVGPATANGCPDADADGIRDADDRCPNAAGPASNGGCPEITEEVKEVLSFAAQAVQFETARSALKQGSYSILDQIVDILRKYPGHKLKVSGHTDSIGSASRNQALSEKRAKSCYDYFVSRGIAPSRLSYAGYGEMNPIADNRYKAGREKNRRVEFEVYLE